ncbi:MAG TPA: hypothetical protein VKQ29_04750 [Aliidongia sp.]|nr:hypothetical protein [Aliidongia sp.]
MEVTTTTASESAWLHKLKIGNRVEGLFSGLCEANGLSVIAHQQNRDKSDDSAAACYSQAIKNDDEFVHVLRHLPDFECWRGDDYGSRWAAQVKTKRPLQRYPAFGYDETIVKRDLAWSKLTGRPVMLVFRDEDVAPIKWDNGIDTLEPWLFLPLARALASEPEHWTTKRGETGQTQTTLIFPRSLFRPLSDLFSPKVIWHSLPFLPTDGGTELAAL